MKIKSAEVMDPRRTSGALEAPYLIVYVDEQPKPLGRVVTVSSAGPQLTFVQHGPFWHIEPHTSESMSEGELGGYANGASPTYLDKLVPVEVSWDGEEGSEWISMFLPVQRSRTLLRKNMQAYEYTLSDIAARHGRIQWDLECRPTMCVHWSGDFVCGDDRIADTVNIGGVQMPACRDHIATVRNTARNLRLERSKA